MAKKEKLIEKLKPVLEDQQKLKRFVVENSNLPGPRGNLELAFALAEVYDNLDVLLRWIQITEDQAGVNDPKSFPAFCAAVCLGKVYTRRKSKKIIVVLKRLANDNRWRMRESVAFAFQSIGEHDFDELKTIFSQWIKKANNFEKRAILVSLAHPRMLDAPRARFCFQITDDVLKQLDKKDGYEVLRKGLEFTISVFVAANPKAGFSFIKRWINKNKDIDKILLANLKKQRLVKKYPQEVKILMKKM